jgi:ubiquinone/menaquinone biosynthesis C-methylase UbiE
MTRSIFRAGSSPVLRGEARRRLLELVGRHVHCGYWQTPEAADGSPEDMARAGDEMCRRLIALAEVADGERVIDIGCGRGGTLEALNSSFGNLALTGVNIDPRELLAARRWLSAGRGNSIELVQADGCAVPRDAGACDLVLAVESIMYMRSRQAFLREAHRLLRPGGRLLVVDFLAAPALRPWLSLFDCTLGRLLALIYPRTDLRGSVEEYRLLAAATGFELERAEDWTRQTLPGYAATRRVIRLLGGGSIVARLLALDNVVIERLSRRGLLRYTALRFHDLRQVADPTAGGLR